MKILAFIPARGGSKGLQNKNIRKLAGKPLVEYTILAAKNSKLIDKIVLSTDSDKIAKIALNLNIEVPFRRPKKLSGDTSSGLDALKHTLKFLRKNQSYVPDVIVFLQPTSPTRTTKMIDDSIKMLKNSDATSVLSVTKVRIHPYSSFWRDGKYLKPFKKDFQKYSLRQKQPVLYGPTGSIYTFWYDTIQKYDSVYGPKIKPMIVDDDDLNLDIDNKFDFFVSEMILLHWKKYKKFR